MAAIFSPRAAGIIANEQATRLERLIKLNLSWYYSHDSDRKPRSLVRILNEKYSGVKQILKALIVINKARMMKFHECLAELSIELKTDQRKDLIPGFSGHEKKKRYENPARSWMMRGKRKAAIFNHAKVQRAAIWNLTPKI
ncbi:hypothetical protein LSTR_LSTR001811 [Laodelphax striatellus]|uniref:Uncharacterized protein n=1 Tax=Laodelphax striatellus TaxID=195883 RepID=A0A482WFT6_LAOST|nr:hypothetical protein LSTR_LSTR001811 [Laodelphax striatellus]